MPTIEFHNELYGYLQEKTKGDKGDKCKDFDKKLSQNGVDKNKKWIRKVNEEYKEEDVTLHTYIRHSIHHPENTNNPPYTDEDLKFSIEEMIQLLNKI